MDSKKSVLYIHRWLLCALMVIFLIATMWPVYPVSATNTVSTVAEVGIPVEEHPELFLTRSMPTHGGGKTAAFLMNSFWLPIENMPNIPRL